MNKRGLVPLNREPLQREVYPGVNAEIPRPYWTPDGRLYVFNIRWVGDEESLRRAGLVQDDDRLPKKPRGDSGFATMRFDKSLRLRLEQSEGAARDVAFRRFMARTLAPNAE
jgi:hypothetical protein